MLIKRYIEFPAFTGVEERKMFIYLPNDYQTSEKYYPVLYMFDGQNVFLDYEATYGRAWRLQEYLDFTGTDLIVVAIECHRGINGERNDEYGPFEMYVDEGDHVAFADDTLAWFIDVLKPQIDEEFRTMQDREHTYVAGSSMGGLLATYALVKYNEVFSKAGSLSPAYLLCRNKMLNLIKKYDGLDGVLYTDYGTDDLAVPKAMKDFIDVNGLLSLKGICVTSRIIKDGVHNEETWEKQVPFMIQVLMYE